MFVQSYVGVCSYRSLTFCKNHHTGVKQEDGHQLPGRVRIVPHQMKGRGF